MGQYGGAARRKARLKQDVGVRRWRSNAMVSQRDLECVHPVMRPARVARRRLQPGTVVLARVPFADDDHGCGDGVEGQSDKIRPVVGLRVSGRDVACLPCTSAVSRFRYPWAYREVQELTVAGLSRSTGIRLRELTLPVGACIEVRGELAESDLERLAEQLHGRGTARSGRPGTVGARRYRC